MFIAVRTGIKSTKNPLPGIAKQGYFYIGIKGVGLFSTRGQNRLVLGGSLHWIFHMST